MLCSPTPTGEKHKRLGGKLIASHRDLTTREQYLPWARRSFPTLLVVVIRPKLEKFEKLFKDKLKSPARK